LARPFASISPLRGLGFGHGAEAIPTVFFLEIDHCCRVLLLRHNCQTVRAVTSYDPQAL